MPDDTPSSSWSLFFDDEIGWEPSESVLGPIYSKILKSMMDSYDSVNGDTVGYYIDGRENGSDQDKTSSLRGADSEKSQTRKNGKRKQDDGNDDDETSKEDDNDGRKRPRQSTLSRPLSQNDRLLACPFCKRDPIRYRDCYKYVLKDISRLK